MASELLLTDQEVAASTAPIDAPAPPGIWAFIAADCAGFGIFFVVFMTERLKNPALFDQSARLLDLRLGLANTLILITSSWLVALALSAAYEGRPRKARSLLMAGMAIGSLFAVLKMSEYAHKIGAGITPMTNNFFTFYFILTGIHFLHYLIGLVVLAAMIAALHRQEIDQARRSSWLEAGGVYWHMVDLLWLFLFPMLYLLPAR